MMRLIRQPYSVFLPQDGMCVSCKTAHELNGKLSEKSLNFKNLDETPARLPP